MGIGSHFNCCKGNSMKCSMIIDDDEQKGKTEEPIKNKNNKNNIDTNFNNFITETNSNHNTNAEYTFQAKSSNLSKGSVIVGEGSGYNNEPFRPVNIPDKFPKESQYSFNAMFQKLN